MDQKGELTLGKFWQENIEQKLKAFTQEKDVVHDFEYETDKRFFE